MNCFICNQAIKAGDVVNDHHVVYRSQGGTQTQPTHDRCHVALHSTRGDFRRWGQVGGEISALSKQWAFNLLNVRTHKAHEINRAFNRAMYAH
jgi:hypothetical protein